MFACQAPSPTPHSTCEVLVIGGGTSGVAAAIQAARSGARVILVEATPWLGGMLTAAGVSATDGNHRLPSGLWAAFRQHLYEHYGGPDSVSTGWVSNTLFEPKVGAGIWRKMAEAESLLQVYHGYRVQRVWREGQRVSGATFLHESGDSLHISALVTVEATELGDVLALAGASYTTGQDQEGRPHDPHVQDLTYSAILQDYGAQRAPPVPAPHDYDPSLYHCICDTFCEGPEHVHYDCETMLNYGRLPQGKFMLNWPHDGNDYYVHAAPMNQAERMAAYDAAKRKTLGLIHFLQTQRGFSHIGLARDEFPTADGLPFIPYHREARRVKGLIRLEVADLLDPYQNPERPYYQQAIAVGDYPLDHHHKENTAAEAEDYPPIPSFSVPYQALVPAELDGLLVAEKSISVSHMVNGATRLQPCVILIGQAAGAAAATSVRLGVAPRELPVRALQQSLLDAKVLLLPFIDVSPDAWYFQAAQKAGLTGLIRGHGVPYKWANQTWFYPDSTVHIGLFLAQFSAEKAAALRQAFPWPDHQELSRGQAMAMWRHALDTISDAQDIQAYFAHQDWLAPWEEEGFDPLAPLTRKAFAWWVDQIYAPFKDESAAL